MINDYALVNGIRLYYEVHGNGAPLVVLHGGGSTIQTSFGNLIPFLAKRYRVIAVELPAGHFTRYTWTIHWRICHLKKRGERCIRHYAAFGRIFG